MITIRERVGYYACYTQPTCEQKAKYGLEAKGYDVYLPMTESVATRWRGKRKVVIDTRKPLFPRYLFVVADPHIGDIKDTDGVADILSNGPESAPSIILPGIIEALKRSEGNGVFDFRSAPAGLHKGDRVRIAEGPFAGFIAEVLLAKPNKRVEVLFDVFGGKSTAEIYAGKLEKV